MTIPDCRKLGEVLERVFNCRVYDQYASSEGAPFVTECEAGGLHVELSTGVFEPFGDANDVLVTSFTTNGTPLIRYRIGDSMVLSHRTTCECTMPSPLVESIQGRSDDFLWRADGVRVNGGNVANLFKNLPNSVIQAQAVQEELGAVTIFLVLDESADSEKAERLLRREFAHKFDPGTELTIEEVKDLPREASGKHRLIKNLVRL